MERLKSSIRKRSVIFRCFVLLFFLVFGFFASVANATVINSLTLRPSSDAYADFTKYGDTSNYKCIDDVSPDDATTFVRCAGADKRDKYGIPDHTTESGVIKNITVFTRGRSASSTDYISIWGDSFNEAVVSSYGASWSNRSHVWTSDPGGGAWTWEDVDDLYIGFRSTNTNYGDITQLYAIVYYYEDVSVLTNASTGVEEGNATLNGFLYNGGNTCTVRFEYGTTTGYGTNTTNQTLNSNTSFNANIVGLSPGTLYHYRAYANDSIGNYSLGDDMTFYTKSEAPTNVGIYSNINSTISLDWTKGVGAGNTVVVRNATGYNGFPSTPTNGTVVYNSTGSGYCDSVGAGYNYSYGVWSWKGDKHSDNYTNVYNLSYPQNPYSMNAALYVNNINITWSAGRGADTTVLVRKSGSPPANPTDGTVLQNSSLAYYNDTVITNSFYTAFSYNDTLKVYSSGTEFEWGGLSVNCFNESNASENLTFDLYISDADAEEVYSATDCENPHTIDISDCPSGADVRITVSSDGYQQRSYIMDLYTGYFYTLNFYLPPELPHGGEDDPDYDANTSYAQLYLLTVENQFDNPVENARMEFRKYINTTDDFETISVLYTDANGEADIYLIPFEEVVIVISKSGYDTKTAHWIPSDTIATKTFRLTFTIPDEPDETNIWDIITFNAYFDGSDNSTLYVSYLDSSGNSSLVWIRIYQNGTDLVFNGSYSDDSDISIEYDEANHSAYDYKVLLNIFNHSNLDNQSAMVMIPKYISPRGQFVIDLEVDLEGILGGWGDFTVGWVNVFVLAIGVFVVVTFGRYWAGLSLITLGLVLGFIEVIIGLPGFTIPQIGIIAFLILFGALVEIAKAKKGARI